MTHVRFAIGLTTLALLAGTGQCMAQLAPGGPGMTDGPLVAPDPGQPAKPVEPQAKPSPLAKDAAPSVTLLRTPDAGKQPEVAFAADGTIHLVTLVGDPVHSNIEYRTRGPHDASFGPPLRVNSQDGSATGIGSLEGPRLALGKDGSVHVVWLGSDNAEPRATLDPKPRPRPRKDGTPLLYSRIRDGKATPQRNLLTNALVADGGAALLADDKGHVLVFANADQNLPLRNMEAMRRIFFIESRDDGETFAAERITQSTIAGTTAIVPPIAMRDHKGRPNVLFRAAQGNAKRDVTWMISSDDAKTWTASSVEGWRDRAVPASAFAMALRGESLLAAWQTKNLNIATGVLRRPDTPPEFVVTMPRDVGPEGLRRDPVMLVNPAGFTLVAWTTLTTPEEGKPEPTSHSICWQVFDSEGRLLQGASGVRSDLPPATRACGWVNADGSFSIMY
ncbi:MAG: sialidase family protein [Planctomycetota bacterium]|nr:sialidase family protein [Planctomycetota bacterium]